MPTNIQSVVYAAVFGRVSAGVSAYNAAIDAATLVGCVKVQILQNMDDRTDARLRTNLTLGPPAGYPKVRLKLSGGDEQKTVTPTFGLAQGAACDAIVPMKIQLVEEITYDPSDTGDAKETPLEMYIDAAYHASGFYPKLGISYCRWFTFTNIQRRLEQINKATHLVRRKTISVDLWPHLAVVQ
jgi:hypothetical protein